MIQLIKTLHLTLALLLEIALLVIAAYWGYQLGKGWMKYSLAIILPVIVVVLWATWAAPRSQHRLEFAYLLLFKLAMFAGATLALFQTENMRAGVIFAALALLSLVLALVFERPGQPPLM